MDFRVQHVGIICILGALDPKPVPLGLNPMQVLRRSSPFSMFTRMESLPRTHVRQGLWGLGLRSLGFKSLGFRSLGFKSLGFRGLEFKV